MNTSFAAVLLAGGKSQRMGQNKAWMNYQGVPLWQRQLELLASLHPTRLLLSTQKTSAMTTTQAEIVLDLFPEAGPLIALKNLLQQVTPLPLLVLAVDLPRMHIDCLQDLLTLHRSQHCGIVYQQNGYYEPLAAIYDSTVPVLSSQRRLQDYVQMGVQMGAIKSYPVPPQHSFCFQNVNTPEEWNRLPHNLS